MDEDKRHILSVLVENEAGVLSQVSRLFSRRGFNIESLAVGTTDDVNVSRMTIVIKGTDKMAEQISKQLGKLQPVISVLRLPWDGAVSRELMLVKVEAQTSQKRDDIIRIVNVFRANVIDMAKNSMTIEVSASSAKSEAMLSLLQEHGIIELVRTGIVAIERGSSSIYDYRREQEEFDLGKK